MALKSIEDVKMIEDFSHKFGKEVGENFGNLTDETIRFYNMTRIYIKKNPVKSISIAISSGLVIGGLFTYYFKNKSN